MNANANARRRTGSPCPEQAPAADYTVEIDEVVADLLTVRDDGTVERPMITLVIDRASRTVLAVHVSFGNGTTAFEELRSRMVTLAGSSEGDVP